MAWSRAGRIREGRPDDFLRRFSCVVVLGGQFYFEEAGCASSLLWIVGLESSPMLCES